MSEKKTRGRPTKYKPDYARQAFRHCLLGATDKDLAILFETTEKTINTWKQEQPKFLQSLKDGKDDADAKVAQAMYKRAVGYEHPEDRVFCNKDGEVTTVATTKHYPPDHGSCMSWLKNRQPGRFRDKQEVDHGVTDDMAELLKEISCQGAGLPIGGKP